MSKCLHTQVNHPFLYNCLHLPHDSELKFITDNKHTWHCLSLVLPFQAILHTIVRILTHASHHIYLVLYSKHSCTWMLSVSRDIWHIYCVTFHWPFVPNNLAHECWVCHSQDIDTRKMDTQTVVVLPHHAVVVGYCAFDLNLPVKTRKDKKKY